MSLAIEACNKALAELVMAVGREQVEFQKKIHPLNEGIRRLEEILQSFGERVEPLNPDGPVGDLIPVRVSETYTYNLPVKYRYEGQLYEIAYLALEQQINPTTRYTFDPLAQKHLLVSKISDRYEDNNSTVPILLAGGFFYQGAYYKRSTE